MELCGYRIYFKSNLESNSFIELFDQEKHYLVSVLRLKLGDKIRVFNEQNGEYESEVIELSKRSIKLRIDCVLRKSKVQNKLILALCVINRDKMLLAVDMAVQCGVTEIIPIFSNRSQNRALNLDKLKKRIIEASEQSERLDLAKIAGPLDFKSYLRLIQSTKVPLIYANEKETKACSIYEINRIIREAHLLIGPEGGFDETEIKALSSIEDSLSFGLGEGILRTETAVVALLSQIQFLRRYSFRTDPSLLARNPVCFEDIS